MFSGGTFRALEITGTAVFRIVVSSDSMKNATATSHGSSRLLASEGRALAGALAGFICLCAMRSLFPRRPLGDSPQIVGPYPVAECRLDIAGSKIDIAARGHERLIERQVQVAPMNETERDIVDAGFTQRDAPQ